MLVQGWCGSLLALACDARDYRSVNDQEPPAACDPLPSESRGETKRGRASETILLALYSENGEIVRTMVEWRHKLILLFVLALGALATSGVWLLEHEMRVTLQWELFAGGVIMCLFTLMEHRTAVILHACYRIGTELETKLMTTSDGVYSALHVSRQKMRYTYSNILRVTYGITAAGLLAAAPFVSCGK